MINKGNRRGGIPIIIEENFVKRLKRIPFREKDYDEKWLQEVIHDNPNILPIDEIDISFSPLISLGKEVSIKSGNIDNVFISPEGYITIIENKLWINPGARREVVGQIIDYAKDLNKLDFTEFDNKVKKSNSDNLGIVDILKNEESISEQQEFELIDTISRNLRNGRFLLLIIGDGIKESVEEMTEYLVGYPQLQFTLALIEIQIYSFGEDPNKLLLIPQIITRTKEITRAVIKFEGNVKPENISVETRLNDDSIEKLNQASYSITAEEFFSELELNTNRGFTEFARTIVREFIEEGFYIEWGKGSFSVRIVDLNETVEKISCFIVDKKGWVYLGYPQSVFDKLGLDIKLLQNFAYKTSLLFPVLKNLQEKDRISWKNYQKIESLAKVYKEFKNLVIEFKNEIHSSLESGT